MLDWIGDGITSIISDLGKWIADLDIDDILSSIVGIIPRSIVFLRSLFMPLYRLIEGIFPSPAQFMGVNGVAFLFFSVIGFIVALGFRRGVTH